MPCYDPVPQEDYYAEYQKVTRIACDMAKFINRTVEHLSPETIAWIVEHERLDRTQKREHEN